MPGTEQRSYPTFPGFSSRRFWEQIRVLTAANLKTRYRKTWAGFLWVILNPLTMYWIQTQVFSRFLKLNVSNYALFLLSGLLPWIFIVQTLEMCASLFVWSSRMFKAFPVSPLVYVFVLANFTRLDYGPIAGGYLGVMLIGALFLAVGTFASSLFKNQVVSAILAFSILLFLWIGGALASFTLPLGAAKSVFGYANMIEHMSEFGKGVIDTRRVLFYLSGAGLFLFLAVRSLEVRKWR